MFAARGESDELRDIFIACAAGGGVHGKQMGFDAHGVG